MNEMDVKVMIDYNTITLIRTFDYI